MDGEGLTPLQADLDSLGSILEAYFAEIKEPPGIYPTPEGGIQLEWILQSRYFTVEIAPGMTGGQLHILEMDTKKDSLTTFDCGPAAWERLAKAVKEHS